MLLAAIQKLDEDCKNRRKEHFQAFYEKYETNDGYSEDEVVDLRTFQVVKKKGKRKKKLDKNNKKEKSVPSEVIKFGELNSYSITLESKRYARQIRKYLRKCNKDSNLDREIEEHELIQATDVPTTKQKNSIDKTDNHEKGDLSEDRSIGSESQNETLPLNFAYNPYFSQFGLHYHANAKLDCLTCDEGQKPRHIEFSTIKRKTKTPEISAYNQNFWCNPKADASIVKYPSTKKKSASKNFNRNSEIQNNKLAETLLTEKTHDKSDGNVSDTTNSNKSLYDRSNSSDTISQKFPTPISGDKIFSIPCNDDKLQETSGSISSRMNNTLPNKGIPTSQPVDYFKCIPIRTAFTEILDKSSESEISNNSVTPMPSITNSSPVNLQKCYVKIHRITLPENVPAGSFKSPESRCDFTPSQNIAISPRFTFMKKSIPANSNVEGLQKLSPKKSNHKKVLLKNKTPAAILKRLRPRCPNSGGTTFKLSSFNECSVQVEKNANYCEGKSHINPNIPEIETNKKLQRKDIYRPLRKRQLKHKKRLTFNTCSAKKLHHRNKTSDACLTEQVSSDVGETNCDASLTMMKRLSISSQSMSEYSSDEQFISKNRNTTPMVCDWENVSQETSNTIMLKKSNIPSKKNASLLKKSDAENFNHYANPGIRTPKNLLTEKSGNRSPPKISSSIDTLNSGRSLGLSSSSRCVTVKDKSSTELPTRISKDVTSNYKDKLQNISYSSLAEVSKTLSSNIICTPTLKKYTLTNIFSSPSKIFDYLSKTSDTEDSAGTSSNEDEIIIPDRSSSVSSHLPVSSHEITKFTCNGSSRDKTSPSMLSNRKNKSRDTSASIMLNKSNIPPKKNVFPLKKSNAENFNHYYVNPSSRTSKIISTNKSSYNNLPKINGPRVTLVSGQPLDYCSSFVTVKDNSGNEPRTHTSKDATSNKDKLRNISYSASDKVSKTFPFNDTCTPKIVKKRQPRKVFPSNISKIFDCDSETSDTEVSSKLSTGKPSDEDDIPNLDRSSSVARHLSISSCGRTHNSGGQQLVPNSNVPSQVCDRKHKSQVTSSAVVCEKSNILLTASENINHGYIKPGNEISGKLLIDKSNGIKDYPKISTSVAASHSFRSRKDYSISSSVNVKNCSSGGHPVTRSKNRIGYSEDNFKKISSNNAPHIGENSAHKDMSTPQIIKKHSRRSKMSASNTCPVPEISSSSTNKDISPPKIVNKQLRCQKIPSPNICSPCGISGNSSKKEILTIHRVKKHHRSRKRFAHNTCPAKTIDNHLLPSVDVSNKQITPYTDNFKTYFNYTKSWYRKQRLIEGSQNCSFDDRPPIDRVLRNKHTGSVCYREDELLNTSYIPPEGLFTPLSKRLKFAPNVPMDCLSI